VVFVGRIKTSFIKNLARDLLEKEPEKFSTDYKKNKEIIKQLLDIKSKRMRNIVAGYITSLKKREQVGQTGAWGAWFSREDQEERVEREGGKGREGREGRRGRVEE